jgi:hypothetical protein
LGDGGTVDIGRLTKAHAERLLAGYDADPIAALTAALQIALDMPGAEWATLVASAPIEGGRRARLLACDERSLDELARELNERRGIDEPA